MARLTLSAATKIVRRGTATPRNLELLQVMRELDEIRRSPYYSGPGASVASSPSPPLPSPNPARS